jgi:hypothetical protein
MLDWLQEAGDLNERTTDLKFYQNSTLFVHLNGWKVTESESIQVRATTTAGLEAYEPVKSCSYLNTILSPL